VDCSQALQTGAMIPVKLTSSQAHQALPNHEPKLSLPELPGDRTPIPLQIQTPAFSRLPVNHCTPYTYIKYPVNHCTPYSYTNDSNRLPLNHLPSNTYIEDCAHCVLAHSAGGQLIKALPTLLGSASTFACIAAGGPPGHPNPRFHPLKPQFQTQTPFANPCEGVPSPNQRSTYGGKDSLVSGLWFCTSSLANFSVGAK